MYLVTPVLSRKDLSDRRVIEISKAGWGIEVFSEFEADLRWLKTGANPSSNTMKVSVSSLAWPPCLVGVVQNDPTLCPGGRIFRNSKIGSKCAKHELRAIQRQNQLTA